MVNHVNVRHNHLETVRSEESAQESRTTHRQRCNHIEQHRAYLRSSTFKTLSEEQCSQARLTTARREGFPPSFGDMSKVKV